jgi:hypothetical protein
MSQEPIVFQIILYLYKYRVLDFRVGISEVKAR